MPFFHASEARARHEFVDASIDNTLDQLRNPTVAGAMNPSELGTQQEILGDLLYVANIRHGEL